MGESLIADPGRVQWELARFHERGLDVTEEPGSNGATVITTRLTIVDAEIEIRAVLPRDYPDVSPLFYAEAGLLARHQHPQGGNLCVAGEGEWWPWRSVAQIVDEEVRDLLTTSHLDPEAIAANEADMPEPLTAMFPYRNQAVVLVPDPLWNADAGPGRGALLLESVPGRAALRLATSASGLGAIESALRQRVIFGQGQVQRGFWVQLDPPPAPDVSDVISRARAAYPELEKRLRFTAGSAQPATVVVGARFTEEGPRRGEHRVAWLFADVVQRRRHQPVVHLTRAQALTKTERVRRIPELIALADASAVIVGAGSVGSPVALELTRAGMGTLHIYDNDFYDVNNSVRHTLSVSEAGTAKATAVAQQCASMNPFVDVVAHTETVGNQSDEEAALLVDRISHAAAVIDTTGMPSVSRLLQRAANAAGVPLITAGLTAGGFGAEVLISRPGGPCRDCFALTQRDASVPTPIATAESTVTPVGCNDPAFIGAGFEASELAAVVARTCVGLIPSTTYPPADFDWMVLNFRTRKPRAQGPLEVHPDCQRH
ncbi:MAG: ThiF family adenylyltransferase [Candidatus Dormibacteraeota bacterium]|uniref:ThiF family adenylyltransferase n=1 Tax=Candidatus Amunia macphersoniae TaxID=3127014 RepID=A0A934KD23_9BACT|nr:ThiF family adenylyltransferase [Candidatus Dormibacteraeota bacterium]